MKIYARNTTVVEVPYDTAKAFIAENHAKGWSEPGKNFHALALMQEDTVLAVATFSNPRTAEKQRKYTTELHRLCFRTDVRISGGASKLIKHYIRKKSPEALFTYQDTGGEASTVYEKAGMALVGDSTPKPKLVLVKNGLSKKTARNNRKDWFSLEQAVKLGPDALLGTKLGEKQDENGARISNVKLFTDFLDYHIEEIPGDRVYEWYNPDCLFYTYKLTSTVDEKYYIGRHVLRHKGARKLSEDKALTVIQNDGYLGSGGKKFQNWVKKVKANGGALCKEILAVYPAWGAMILDEQIIIGDKHKTDENCMNTLPGGVGQSINTMQLSMRECSVHGLTKFLGNSCCKCASLRTIIMKECPVHGLTKFQGNKCYKCLGEKSVSFKECPVHGTTAFKNNKCFKCSSSKATAVKECPIHGLTKFIGDECSKCRRSKAVVIRTCPIHGETKFANGSCFKCANSKSIEYGLCPTHGETKFKKDKCYKCTSEKSINQQVCELHGETKFVGDKCCKCIAEKTAHTRFHMNKPKENCRFCKALEGASALFEL